MIIEEALKDVPKKMRVRILFEDESRFGRISDKRHCWGPLPKRPQVGQQIVRESIYTIAAVSPYDGSITSLIMPWLDSEIMSIFLAHTAQIFSNDFCILFMDRAGWHIAESLRIPKNMKLLFLPPYSPELNPVEILWSYIKVNYIVSVTKYLKHLMSLRMSCARVSNTYS